MRILPAARMSGAWWFVPLVFALQSLVLHSEVTPTGYVQSDYAQAATFGLYPSSPLLAAVAALCFRGFRRFHLDAPQARRFVVVRAFVPLVGGSATAVVVTMVLRVQRVPEDSRTWGVLALVFLVVLACGTWGLAMARIFPTVLAVPLAAAAPLWWITVTPSLEGGVARHLAPEVLCCRVDSQLSPGYLVGLGSLAVLLVVGLGVQFVPRSWSALPAVASLGVVLAATAVATGIGVALVRLQATPTPTSIAEVRTTALACSTRDSLPVCLWPEQAPDHELVASEIQRLNGWLRARDMPPVAGVDQRAPASGRIALRTAGTDLDDVDELRILIAAAYVAREAGCPGGLRGDGVADERVAALAIAMGWRFAGHDEFPPAAVEVAVRRTTDDAVRFDGWFRSDLDQVHCARRR